MGSRRARLLSLFVTLLVVAACFNAGIDWSRSDGGSGGSGGGSGGDAGGGGDGDVSVTAISPSSGHWKGGTSVTLTGTGFASGATISVAGTACTSVNVVSSTSATCTTGQATQNFRGDVVLTNPDSSGGTLDDGFTLNYYAYVTDPNAGKIYGFSLPESGPALDPPGSPYSVSVLITAMGMHPGGRSFHIAGSSGGAVVKSLAVAEDGSLTGLLPTATTANSPLSMAFDPVGRFMYITHPSNADTVDWFSFGSDGRAVAESAATFPGQDPWMGIFHPTLSRYYVIYTSTKDLGYHVPNPVTGDAGMITFVADNQATFFHLSLSAARKLLFATTNAGGVYVLTLDSDGDVFPIFPAEFALSLGASPRTAPNLTGTRLYAATAVGGEVFWYDVSTGATPLDAGLTPAGSLTFGNAVNHVGMHPTGTRLVAVDSGAKKLWLLDVSPTTGSLSSPVAASTTPNIMGNLLVIY